MKTFLNRFCYFSTIFFLWFCFSKTADLTLILENHVKVGDNVGDCAARGADLFESIAAEIISAMILGGTMAQRCKIEGRHFNLNLNFVSYCHTDKFY